MVSQVVERVMMNSAVLSHINTDISKLGLTSAGIVMTDGGLGPTSGPFTFTVENIAMLEAVRP